MPGIRHEPFSAAHIDLIDDAGAQEWLRPYFSRLAEEAEGGIGISFFAGQVFLGAGGIMPIHDFRAVAWGIFVPGYPQHFLGVWRISRAFIAERLKTYPRIEAYIDPDFSRSVRFVKALGFREETARKPYFFPDGRPGAEWVIFGG